MEFRLQSASVSADPDKPPTAQASVAVSRAGGIMMFSILLSRLLGLLRDTVMASQFGLGLNTDAYRLAVTIPDTIFFLIAGGGLSSAFIPVFSEYIHTNRERDAWKLFSVVTTVSTVVVSLLIGLAWIFAPQIAGFFAAGKTDFQGKPISDQLVPIISDMGRIMLPAQLAFMVGSVLLATLYARQRFVAPGIAPNVYNVGIIVGALVGPAVFPIGIYGMAWGALIGACIGNLFIPSLVMVRLGGRFSPSLDLRTPGLGKFLKLLAPVILGFSLPSVAALITQKFASLYEPGVNTVLNLSNTLMLAPNGIFGQSLALAAFPVLSQFFAQGKMDLYREQVSRTVRAVIYLSIAASALIYALAPMVVTLAYGYGKAAQLGTGSLNQLDNVAQALRIYSFGIFAWCVQPVLMRGFFSVHKTLKPVLLSTLVTALFVLLCWGIGKIGLGYMAIPWASNLAAILLLVLLYGALQMEVGGLQTGLVALTLVKSLAAALLLGGVCYGLMLLLHGGRVETVEIARSGRMRLLIEFLVLSSLGGWVFYWITSKLGMSETETVSRAMARINRRLRPISEVEAREDL